MRRRSAALANAASIAVTSRGRRSPSLVVQVKTAAGETRRLSGLQWAQLLLTTSWINAGRHRWTFREVAIALSCSPGTVSKTHRRLRSLSLIGGPTPTRGRHGGAITWIPTPRSQRRDAALRRLVWPSANDSTLTTYGGYLSRAGAARAWRRRTGSPPGARPPDGWAAPPSSPRARGRPWPPAYVDELCPSRRRVGRIRRSDLIRSGPDVVAVYAGRCPRCHRAHVATLPLVGPLPPSARRPGDRAPTPDQVRLAGELVGSLDADVGDVVRERYLGWIRTPIYEPPIPALVDGPLADLADLVATARAGAHRELAAVASTRQLIAPGGSPP